MFEKAPNFINQKSQKLIVLIPILYYHSRVFLPLILRLPDFSFWLHYVDSPCQVGFIASSCAFLCNINNFVYIPEAIVPNWTV